jgi:putative aldouronate transport system substrate-binding protein
MPKLRAFLLTLALLVPALAAAQDAQTSFPIVNEPITLTLMGSKAGIQGEWETLRLFTRMAELTNVNVQFMTVPDDGYNERKNLTFASGQLPDLFFGGRLTASDEVTYGAQGFLIPLEDLIAEHAPNLQRILDENPDIRSSITAPDGHIYALPKVTAGFGVYPKLWINGAWLETLELGMPTTTQEFYQVLVAFRDGDPNGNGQADEIPLTATNLENWPLGDIRPGMLAAFGFTVGYGKQLFDVHEGRVRFVPGEENFRAYLEYMNRLYSEGLLDPDAFTQNTQQVAAKGQEDRLGAFTSAGPFLVVGTERNTEFPQLQPLTSEVSPEPVWPRTSNVIRGTFAITRANQHPEATIRWVDYFYSPEGALLQVFGVEGESWEYTEAGGLRRIVPEGMNPEEYRAGQVTPDAGSNLPQYRPFVEAVTSIGIQETNPQNYYIGQETREKLEPVARPTFPLLYFTEDEQMELNFLLADLESFVQQAEARFITGQQPLSEWESYLSTLNRIGAPRVLEIYQAAFERWQAAGETN